MKAKAGRFGTQPTGSRYRDVVLGAPPIVAGIIQETVADVELVVDNTRP